MPAAVRKAIIELPTKDKGLAVREAKAIPDSLQHGIHNEAHGLSEGCVGQFICHEQEHFANGSVLLIPAFAQGEEHVTGKDRGNMSVQGVIGQGVTF